MPESVGAPSGSFVADLESTFDAELARGLGDQHAYQRYEDARIAAGVPITDDHFFDAFHAGREPFASPIGPEEWFASVPRDRIDAYRARKRSAWAVLSAGLAALTTALIMRRPKRSDSSVTIPTST